MNQQPRTIIITGASSGIGLALAEAYLKRGDRVVGNARSSERLEAAAAALGHPGSFVGVAGDIAEPATAQALFRTAIERFGRIDVLINNAGIFIAKPFADYTPEDVQRLVATNLMGFFYPSQLAATHMAANGAGHIVNITASVALQPNGKAPAVLPVLVKGGLNSATRALALELAPHGVKVTAVAPGIIDTPLHPDGAHEFLKGLQPSGAYGQVKDIVDAVLYMTDASFTTGVVLSVDGGATAGVW
ncbi:SDR family NAD(P)-dependent oxidoreductase [Telluria aromaticivorans]|uniref:SDR family oxidoreductase n=1 Tax=Telluria aromaticivorans TaxID=2725995 RepID=A0A7Y2NYY6_9BURK|nr:SDR family oxidoreductase [Telluria aromaticivorans]NNG23337.1 SDR family oxidoreductase [Telluria aromaticivorans]